MTVCGMYSRWIYFCAQANSLAYTIIPEETGLLNPNNMGSKANYHSPIPTGDKCSIMCLEVYLSPNLEQGYLTSVPW